MRSFWRKLTNWRHRDSLHEELKEEIETHLAMKAAGSGDARGARQQFGNPTLILADAHDAWGWPKTEAWLRDFRFGLRMMKRRPGLAVTIIAILGLGIGAASTIFSLVDAVLIRPLPYPQADQLVDIHEVRTHGERTESRVAPGRLEDWNRMTQSFEALAGSYLETFTETSGSLPEQMSGAYVSPRFFSVFRTKPNPGRTFTAGEEMFGGPLVVVISHGLWRSRFHSDPAVIGRTLVLSGQTHVVVGVMPASFQHPSPSTRIWAPKQARPALFQVRSARFYDCVGLMKPDVTLAQGRADLESVGRKLAVQYPKTDAGWSVSAYALKDRLVGNVRLTLWLLFGSALVLLLIACTNVACLLLAQANSRIAEMATRRALGAGRTVIVRQLLAEGLAYAVLGSLLGIVLAFAGVALFHRMLLDLPRIAELAVDIRLLLFAVTASAAAALFFSVAPIAQIVRRDRNHSIVSSSRGVIGNGQRMPRFLVSAQFALATVLLVGSGLFMNSLLRLRETPLGFRTEDVLSLRVTASFSESSASVVQRHRRTMEALTNLPVVQHVAMSSGNPGTHSGPPLEFKLPGSETDETGNDYYAAQRIVTSGYFQTLGIPLTSGRTCRMNADPEQPFEALVNQAFARRFLPGRDPVGMTVIHGPSNNARTMRIAGVVGDTRELGFARAPEPLIYACGFLRFWPDSEFLIQTRTPAASTIMAVRKTMAAIEPARATYAAQPLETLLSATLSHNRFRAWLLSLFSAFAVVLAAAGLYGVMAYSVSQRTREFGVRIALGARSLQIWGGVLRSCVTVAAFGAGSGVVLAWAASKSIAALLYGTASSDVASYLYAIGILGAAAALACLPPGKRATSIDPARALREA